MRHAAQTGFSLIELMVAMAVVAILAAIAMPAYENYIMRTRVTELVLAASSGRSCVVEAITNNGGQVPATISTLCTIAKTPNISTTEVANDGKITVLGFDSAPASGGGGCAQQTGPGITINLTPTVNANKEVTWACSGTPSKFIPSSCH